MQLIGEESLRWTDRSCRSGTRSNCNVPRAAYNRPTLKPQTATVLFFMKVPSVVLVHGDGGTAYEEWGPYRDEAGIRRNCHGSGGKRSRQVGGGNEKDRNNGEFVGRQCEWATADCTLDLDCLLNLWNKCPIDTSFFSQRCLGPLFG
ncbi:MAG: hypothetical protein K0Q94_3799 [Paenibacillus sp.]|jgi:hypothetical protein|nr:hypothetical protein [Paenibacillus sp.]